MHQSASLLKEAGASALALKACQWRTSPAVEQAALWDDLAARAGDPNPFFERWALLPALAQFGSDHPVELVTLMDGDELVGLMPVSRSRDYYGRPIPHLSVWLHYNAFCGVPLVAAGYEPAFWTALMEWADDCDRSALFMHLSALPTDSANYRALQDIASIQNRPAAIVMQEERAMLRSDLSPEEYFAQAMSSKKRKELRRQHKRLSEAGELVFQRSRNSDDIDDWIAAYLALEQAGWKGGQATSLADAESTRTFFRQALTGAADIGRLERLTLSLDGIPIAMLANFIAAPGAYSFKTTFDERYARFSPGVQLQRENLDILTHPSVEWTDSCAAADHPMIERIWREKRTIVRANIALGGPLRRNAMRALTRLETGSFPKGL